MTWIPTPNEDDFYYARLPFTEAQAKFAETAPELFKQRSTLCGWHGEQFDQRRGALAIVRDDGPLVDLVGERVIVRYDPGTAAPRSVLVYVHDQAAIIEDLSLTRAMFIRLAPLWTTDIQVSVAPTAGTA